MKKAIAIVLAVVMALSMGAFQGRAAADAAKNAMTVRIATIPDYNPFNNYTSDQYAFMNAVYATLIDTAYDAETQEAVCKPDLAESWEVEEGYVWVFHLAENATFSNGEPVTAEDVVFSIEQAKESLYLASITGAIASAEARDAHTVAITVGYNDRSLPWQWDHIYIVNKAAYEADVEAYIKAPVASGAYTIESIDDATGNVTLKARADYWKEPAAIETVYLRNISDNTSASIALESGEIDLLSVYGDAITQLSKNKKVVLEPQASNMMGGLFFNCQVAPWDNVKLRQAVACVVDYAALQMLVFDGWSDSASTVAYNTSIDPLPAGTPEFSQDITRAMELVAESGLPTPINGGNIIGGGGGLAELIQQYLSLIGIETEISDLTGNDFVMALMTGNFTLASIPGASSAICGSAMVTNTYTTNGAYNYQHYSNPAVDALAVELQTAEDDETYNAKLAEVMAIIAEDSSIVSFGCGQTSFAHADGLYVPTAFNGELFIDGCHW